ncbi:MAG: metallophosphoesterase [Clostridia bacterium]|nr:metallophosphoesterase [Clostridia bacterium]
MKDFLACFPNVFAIHSDYQIVINLIEPGACRLRIGSRDIYEPGYGVYRTERKVHKFTVPQKLLDSARAYTVLYRQVSERKAYFSVSAPEEESRTFSFRPITKTEDIRAVYIADVHGNYNPDNYSAAERAARAFGEVDFYIINGDIGEIETEEMLVDINAFIGRLSGGEMPVIVGRGNHDTRGKLAELLPEHIATDGDKTYFNFTLGPIGGVVIDCGEDKLDSNIEYGGVNCFEQYRIAEARDLTRMKMPEAKYTMAISHIAFMTSTAMHGGFDIMPETYAIFGRALNRMNPDFFIGGHSHRFEYYPADDARAKIHHRYPVIVGSRLDQDGYACTGIVLRDGSVTFTHLLSDGSVLGSFGIPRNGR